MYEKALTFQDNKTASKILKSKTASDIQQLGREVTRFDDEEWGLHKTWIVKNGTYFKFTISKTEIKGKTLKQLLLDTGDRELVEATSGDRYWGIGYDSKNAEKNRADWAENIMGRILMCVRSRIRDEDAGVSAAGQE